jgi:hypothetical protein
MPSTLDSTASSLLIVDFQSRLMPAIEDGPAVVADAWRLLQAARLLGIPVLKVHQGSNLTVVIARTNGCFRRSSATQPSRREWLFLPRKRHSMHIGGKDCGDTAGSVRTVCLATILEPVAVKSGLPQFHSGQ